MPHLLHGMVLRSCFPGLMVIAMATISPGMAMAAYGKGPLNYSQATAERVTGRVTNAQGEPVTGVTVAVAGTASGTTTDQDGRYAIQVERGQTLVFSSIGYTTRQVVYDGQASVDIVLQASSTQLTEVVAVAYGTQKKVSLTSAVGQINGTELTHRPVTSIQQALQGKTSGLAVLDNGGSPGSPNTNMVVRGINTPYTPVGLGTGQIAQIGDNGPLVIVDGIEQPFANINPNDIESVSVLKDASSTAIYGSRAANGVILITTKRGEEGKLSLTYNGFYAIQRSVSKPVHMDIESYLRLQNAAYQNVGSAPKYSEEQIQEYVKGSVSDPLHYPLPFDWYNVMLRDAPQTNHTLSLSGGNKTVRARMSLRFQDQEGIIANTDSKLSEVRVNADFRVSPKISLSTDVNYRYQNVLQPHNINEIFRQFMQNSIWAVPKYPDGTYGGGTQGNNPLLLAEAGGTDRTASDYIIGNVSGDWKIIKGLTFTSQFAARVTDVFEKDYVNTWETRDSTKVKKRNLHNNLTETRVNVREYTLNNLLRYSGSFGGHGISALLGYSQIEHRESRISAYRQDFYNNDVTSIGQGANDATKDNGGGDAEWGLRSYFGRVNYNFRDRYLFEANARYDGSSRFTGDNRYSFFPSFSAGWRLSQERFWESLNTYVSEFKLRGSWGETGNQAVALYSYYPTLDLVNYSFSGEPAPGYVERKLANPDLTWETTRQTDIGLDAEFLRGAITLTVDYYKKTTEGILLTLPVPSTLGLQAGPQNAGTVENKGWEFTAGTRHQFGKFGLDARLNFSINENKVIDLAGTGPYINGNDIDPRYITAEGYPVNAFWGYLTDGLFQSDDEAKNYPEFMRPAKAGDVKVLDRDQNGSINPDDMTYLGNSFPKYTFGGLFTLTYKAFTLNLALQGAADVGMRVARALGEAGNYEGFTPDIYTNNYWTPEHTDARFARPTKQDLRNQASTDRMILNASYLRLKNFQLVYNLPTTLTKKVFLNQASIYVSGTNLVTLSALNDWHLDPESSSGWQNYYPQTALYTFGISLGL